MVPEVVVVRFVEMQVPDVVVVAGLVSVPLVVVVTVDIELVAVNVDVNLGHTQTVYRSVLVVTTLAAKVIVVKP